MSLLPFYESVRQHTRTLCEPLGVEDYIPQPVFFASPPKWHLAHTTWFFEEFILKNYQSGYKEFNDQFNYLFNSYYNNAGERIHRETRGSLTRPPLEEVIKYRDYVDEAMVTLIEQTDHQDIKDMIKLGLNHEQQHQELLLTDLKHTFSFNPIWPVYDKEFNLVNSEQEAVGFTKIPEGIYAIGYEGEGFCYDNEKRRHKVFLHGFEISNNLVTNEDYVEFIKAGGYKNFNIWLDEGWQWVQEHNISSPLYWLQRDGQWWNYTLAGLMRVNPKAPVCHVNFYEASAFAEWKGMRLPTEFEWEAAANQIEWGSRWEWTNSAYLPYPFFETAEGAIGEYNGKFMVNQMVLRGQSVATSPGHSRKTYRNFFHPPLRWQYSGFRLIKK